MANTKIKVYNDNKFPVGLKSPNELSKRGVNIPPKSFRLVERSEVERMSAETTLFSSFTLRFDDKKLMDDVGIDEKNPNNLTEEEMRSHLMASANAIKAWLETVTEAHVRAKIYEVADTMDLNNSKMKVLREMNPNYRFKIDIEADEREAKEEAGIKTIEVK